MTVTDETLTREDLAGLLRVSERTLRRMERRGAILSPLACSSQQQPRWLSGEVAAWLMAGAPPASAWREQRQDALAH